MSVKFNNKLLKDGFAPGKLVADAIEKHLTTVYRMCEDNGIQTILDGNVRYVSLAQLRSHYFMASNSVMVEAIDTLTKQVARLAQEGAPKKGPKPKARA